MTWFAILGLVVVASVGAVVWRGSRRRRRRRLEARLDASTPGLERAVPEDWSTRTGVLPILRPEVLAAAAPADGGAREVGPATTGAASRAAALRSRDADRVRAALDAAPLTRDLVPLAIPLLAWDAVAEAVLRALRPVAAEHAGALLDHLLDPDEEFATRRRVPLLLAHCPTQRVVDGLAQALRDARFEVRYRCGRALRRLVEIDPGLHPSREAVLRAVLAEATAQRSVWESQRLLDAFPEEPEADLDAVVRARSNRSLEHVFNLLALVLPRQPILTAFHGLHTDDAGLRRTALEYLESALPADVRARLWPFLRDDRPAPAGGEARPALDRLLESQASIQIQLEDLRRHLQKHGESEGGGG